MARSGSGRTRYDSPSRATFSGILDLLRRRGGTGGLEEADRIDGRVCLVTGANRGLGRAVAIELARRGGRVIMGCRSGPAAAEAAAEIRRLSGNPRVETAFLDLSDFETVRSFVKRMHTLGGSLDLLVLNAGVVPRRARRTAQGFEEMFAVNYLANFLLVTRLLESGVVRPEAAPAGRPSPPLPRIVFVSSESHRSAAPLNFDTLGAFQDYGMRGSMAVYASTKLLVSTFAVELSRRLRENGRPSASVHHLCPGPVDSGIAREAPGWIKPLLKVVFALFFRSPRKAAGPVVYLCCARSLEGRSGVYLHLMTEKQPAEQALDDQNGARLWDASARLLAGGPPHPPPAANSL
jgi:NAD(P)-dependent dehydrogenase (short-subunit alcohol dehydrogenase family)